MKKLMMLSCILFVLWGCKKSDGTAYAPPVKNMPATKYMPLDSGNYWIYDHYATDSFGVVKGVRQDSVFVLRNEMINGHNYAVMAQSQLGGYSVFAKLRDSAGYLVDEHGDIRMTPNNFTDTLSFANFYHSSSNLSVPATYKMEKLEKAVRVPAGIFLAINFQGTVFFEDTIKFPKAPYLVNNYYGLGVGKIYESRPVFENGIFYWSELLRYRVN